MWQFSIKLYLEGAEYMAVGSTYLAHDKVQRGALMITEMNLRIPYNERDLLNTEKLSFFQEESALSSSKRHL
jgi:hypothetical protein